MPDSAQGEILNKVTGKENGDKINEEYVNGGSGVAPFFEEKIRYVFGPGELDDLLSVVDKSARWSYVTAWKHWFQSKPRTQEKRWITKAVPKRDESIVNWILLDTRISGLQASTMRSKFHGYGIGTFYLVTRIGVNGAGGTNIFPVVWTIRILPVEISPLTWNWRIGHGGI